MNFGNKTGGEKRHRFGFLPAAEVFNDGTLIDDSQKGCNCVDMNISM